MTDCLLKSLHHLTFPPKAYGSPEYFTHSLTLYLSDSSNLVEYKEVPHCFFICISLLANDTVHLPTYMLAMCLSSPEKCLFGSSAHFSIGSCIFLLSCKRSWYILYTCLFSNMWLANISSHSVGYHLPFLEGSFKTKCFTIFVKYLLKTSALNSLFNAKGNFY